MLFVFGVVKVVIAALAPNSSLSQFLGAISKHCWFAITLAA